MMKGVTPACLDLPHCLPSHVRVGERIISSFLNEAHENLV